MIKAYKIVLIIMITISVGYLTYQHYTDPIYQLKVGTTLNYEDKKIENWSGRFLNDEELIYIGYRTRLEAGTLVEMNVFSEDSEAPEYSTSQYVARDFDFHYVRVSGLSYDPGHYKVTISIDDEIMETTTFIIEEVEE